MPFGAWTEEDWRLRDRWSRAPGPYLINDEASTPSDVLLQAKAEARRMRSAVSLSKASLAGKTLSRGGASLGSTHFSSRMQNSSTSIGELQDSVDTVQTLSSPFSSRDDNSEFLLEHSEMILQNWKKEGRPKLWLAEKILGSPRGDTSMPTFEDGVDHTFTSSSMVLFKVENDSYGTAVEEPKFTVSDAVQLIAGGTVIGAVAEDMLRKIKNSGGARAGLSKSYIETCERFGKLADKVKEVFEQMEEISKFEVEKANLRVKLRAGDVNAGQMAKALGRDGDVDLIAKISAASEHDEEDEIDGKERLISDIEAMLNRNDLAILLKEVLGVLEKFKWQDMATELRKWIFASDNSENVIRRVIDESVELQREAIGVLTLSKFLAEETLSSHMLLAARNLADFHEAMDKEMKLMLEKCGLDDSITIRMLTDAKSQMLVEGYSTQKSGFLEEELKDAGSGRGSRSSMLPGSGINPSEFTDEQKMMVYERDAQRRNHKRIMSDLYALVQEHKRKVELNRSLHDHMMMTTMRTAPSSRPPSSQDGQSYLKLAMSKKEQDDPMPALPEPDAEDSASDAPDAVPEAVAAAAAAAAAATAKAVPSDTAKDLQVVARKRRKSVTAGKWNLSIKKDDKAPSERHKDPAHRNAKPQLQVGAMRLLQSAKAAVDDLISKSAEKNVLEESALKYLKKHELQRRKVRNTVSQIKSLRLKPKGSISDIGELSSSLSSRSGSFRGSAASVATNRRMTSKTGEPANQLQWLRMRRDWLNKDLNEKVIKVTLEELFKEEKEKAEQTEQERQRRGEEADALASLAQQKTLVGAQLGVQQDGSEIRTRSRRRAVLMEQQTEAHEEEGFQAQVPKAVLQALASERDDKQQAFENCKSNQDVVAKKVMKAYGPNTWDYRLEAQYCIFFTNGWSMVLDRLEEDLIHLRTAIPLLDRLGLQTRLEHLGEELRDCRDGIKELGRLQDEVRRKKNTPHSAEAEQAAELFKKKLDKQHCDFLKRMKDWVTEVSQLDLNQVFEAKETREQRMLKLQSEAALAQRKINDGAESLTKVVEENEEAIMEKALLEHLVEHSSVLSRVTAQRKDASQEFKKLQKEAKEAGLISRSESLRTLGSFHRSESGLRRGESFRSTGGDDGTGSGGLDSRSPKSPRSPRSPKKKSTFQGGLSQGLVHIEESVPALPAEPGAGGGPASGTTEPGAGAGGADPLVDALASPPTSSASGAAAAARVAKGGPRGTVRGSVLQGGRKGPRPSGMAKQGVSKAAEKLLEKGPVGALLSSGDEAVEASEAFAKVLDNAVRESAQGRKSVRPGAPGARATLRGSKVHHGKMGEALGLGAAQLQGKALVRKLQQKQEELDKVRKEIEGKVGKIKKEGCDTAAGWEEKTKKLEQDTKTSEKMMTFWAQKLVEWHQDVHLRCGDEVLEELLKLSEVDAASRDVSGLHEALLRRAREEKAEIERINEVQRSMKDRLATAVETGDLSLFNLQQEVSNVISGLKAQPALAVGSPEAGEELPRALKPRVAITPQQKSGRPPRNKLTAVEEKRQQLAKLRMSQISAANVTVEKRKAKKTPMEKLKEDGDEEHAAGVDLQVEAPEAPKVDPLVARTRRSLFTMRRQLGDGRRRAITSEMGLLCRPVTSGVEGPVEAALPGLPETDLLSLQLRERPKVKPTLALNHKARQQRAKARNLAAAASSEPVAPSKGGIRKLEELDRDSVSSASDRLSSESSDEGRRERKHSNASVGEDLGLWTLKTPAHRALMHLRACRVKLIQRFGGVDKAYIRCVPALTGMTRDVFRQVVNMMGFNDEDASEMYDLMKSHRPPKKRRVSVSGPRSISKQVEQEEPIDRTEFTEAMRKATAVKGLIQLRRRLRTKHNSCEAATAAAFGKRQALDREAFRDFMIDHGVSGREAYQHFMRMTKHNEGGGLAEPSGSGHEDAPQEVTRFAFMKSLLHAEGLEAADAFRAELVELLFNRGGRAGLASDQRGRRTAALLTQELVNGLSEGVDRVWLEVESPPVARRHSRSLPKGQGGDAQLGRRGHARQSVLQTTFGVVTATEAALGRRLSAAGPSSSQRRLSAAPVKTDSATPFTQLKQDLATMFSAEATGVGQVRNAVPEGGSSKHFNADALLPSQNRAVAAQLGPSTSGTSGTTAGATGPRRASFSTGGTAALLHAGAQGAALMRRRSVDEVPASALRRRSLAQPMSGAMLLSGAHVTLEPTQEDSDSDSSESGPPPRPGRRRNSSRSSGFSGTSRRSSLSSSSGLSDSHSSRSASAPSLGPRESLSRLSIFARKMHDETELQYDKVLIKVFDQLVCGKVDLWQPLSRDDFVFLVKNLRFSEDAARAIFKLSARADGRTAPGEVLLRVLGGFGRKYRKLRELCGLKVEFSSRQSSKRPSEEMPPGAVSAGEQLEAEKPKAQEIGLAIGFPVDKGKEEEEAKQKARARLSKAVRKIGLTFNLSKSDRKGESAEEPSVTTQKSLGESVASALSNISMGQSDSDASVVQGRRMSAVSQVEMDLAMLGSQSLGPRRRSSFSGHQVMRRASTELPREEGRRNSFDADWLFGPRRTDADDEQQDWAFDSHVWQSRCSKDPAAEKAPAPPAAPSPEELEDFRVFAEAEVRQLEQRRKLFSGEAALQWSMALEALQQSCLTLRQSFKGSSCRAFEYLAGSSETLGEDELREALTSALNETSLTIPLWQVEGMVKVLLGINGEERISKAGFQRAVHFLQPCSSLAQLRARLVARYGTLEAGLEVLRKDIDQSKAMSVDQFEPVFLFSAGVLGQEFSQIFQEACLLGGTEGLDGIVTVEGFQTALNHGHILQSLQLWHQKMGGSHFNAWLEAEDFGSGELSEILKPLPQEVIEQVTSLVHHHGGEPRRWLQQLQQLPLPDGGASNGEASQEEAALEAARELHRHFKDTYDNFKEAYEAFNPREDGLTLEDWEEKRPKDALPGLSEDSWALIYTRMVGDGKNAKVTLKDLATSLSLAEPVETLYALRLRCQKLHGSVSNAWAANLGDADEVTLVKWQQWLLKMSINHFDSLQLFRLIITSPFAAFSPPPRLGGDTLGISRGAFLAAMRGPAIDASNTILELLQQSRSRFPVSAAFERTCFPRHPLDQSTFSEAVAPVLQNLRGASQIWASSDALREEGTLLFNYLDVHSEGLVMVEDLLALMTSVQAAYLFTEDPGDGAFATTPRSSIWRWQKRQARLQGRSGQGEMRDTVSTMLSMGDDDRSDSQSEATSRPTTMGSRGTVRLPGSRGRQENRPMTSPFEVGGILGPLHETRDGSADATPATAMPAVSALRASTSAVNFAKKLQSKASARPGSRSSRTAPSSSSDLTELGQVTNTGSRVPKLPALQEKQETMEAGAAPTTGAAPLVLGMKAATPRPRGASSGPVDARAGHAGHDAG